MELLEIQRLERLTRRYVNAFFTSSLTEQQLDRFFTTNSKHPEAAHIIGHQAGLLIVKKIGGARHGHQDGHYVYTGNLRHQLGRISRCLSGIPQLANSLTKVVSANLDTLSNGHLQIETALLHALEDCSNLHKAYSWNRVNALIGKLIVAAKQDDNPIGSRLCRELVPQALRSVAKSEEWAPIMPDLLQEWASLMVRTNRPAALTKALDYTRNNPAVFKDLKTACENAHIGVISTPFPSVIVVTPNNGQPELTSSVDSARAGSPNQWAESCWSCYMPNVRPDFLKKELPYVAAHFGRLAQSGIDAVARPAETSLTALWAVMATWPKDWVSEKAQRRMLYAAHTGRYPN